MKLVNTLDLTNTLEKNSFYKILDQLVDQNDNVELEEIISNNNRELKNIDHENIARVFDLVENDYKGYVKSVLNNSLSQLDILIDIITRDGNCILTRDWFNHLYNESIKDLELNVKNFHALIDESDKSIDLPRLRDYRIYRDCVSIAYTNDEVHNSDFKITDDEYSILRVLSDSLGLSNEEVRLIHYKIIPLTVRDIDDVIKELKELGLIFYSRKNYSIYVPDEMVRILRELRGKLIADKYFRRILLLQKDSVINLISRRHNIDWKLDIKSKIKKILNEGISIHECLSSTIFKEDISLTDRKKEINTITEKLGIQVKGSTIEDKIENIITHFKEIERDERVGISLEGYQKLLIDLNSSISNINELLRTEFELQESVVTDCDFLLNLNIKPLDVLEVIDMSDLKQFVEEKEIKSRGNIFENILDFYTDSKNLMLENFVNIGNRDLAELKNNNIELSTAEFGVKYEELAKLMFADLGFDVDDKLRAEINSTKDKIDILLNIGENELIIVECKTVKSTKYNKFSAVSRQIKSYQNNATKQGYKVAKTLLVAPDFSEDFINECELEYELNLSLIKSEVLYNIWDGFKEAKHKVFPVNLLRRDVIIDDIKILKALGVK